MGKVEIKFAEPPEPAPTAVPVAPDATAGTAPQAVEATAEGAETSGIDGYAPVPPLATGAPLPPPPNLIIVQDGNLTPFMTSATPAVLVFEDRNAPACDLMRPVLAAAARQFPDVKFWVVEDTVGLGVAGTFNVTTYPTLLFRSPPNGLQRVNGAISLQELVPYLESPPATAKH